MRLRSNTAAALAAFVGTLSVDLSLAVTDPIQRYVLGTCDDSSLLRADHQPALLGSFATPNTNTFRCDALGGVRLVPNTYAVAPFETNTRAGVLQEHFGTAPDVTGLTLGLWFRPDVHSEAPSSRLLQPIVTIGTARKDPPDNSGSNHSDFDWKGCSGYDLQIAQGDDRLFLSFSDGDGGHSCRYLRLPHITLTSGLTHVAISLRDGSTAVYLNGKSLVGDVPNNFDVTLSHWDRDLTVQLFATHQEDPAAVFSGSVHQVSIFDQFIDSEQAAQLFDQGPVPVNVRSNLQVLLAEPVVSLSQDATEMIDIVMNGAPSNWTPSMSMELELVSIPLHGTLSSVNFKEPIRSGTRLPLAPGSTTVRIQYALSQTNYFNVPRLEQDTPPDSFAVRLVATDNVDQAMRLYSEAVVQTVRILRVNVRPVLRTPLEALPSPTQPGLFTIDGLQLSDDNDHDLDLVRVDLSANSGWLSLEASVRYKAKFTVCQSRTDSSWQCVGNGLRDRRMTFVATPSDAQLLLDTLRYESITDKSSGDSISIRIFDGQGGDCLSAKEHARYRNGPDETIRRECFEVEGNVAIPALSDNVDDDTGESGFFAALNLDLRNFGIADLMFWIVMLSIGGCCCCSIRHLLHCLARGKPIEIDDFSVDSVESDRSIASSPPCSVHSEGTSSLETEGPDPLQDVV